MNDNTFSLDPVNEAYSGPAKFCKFLSEDINCWEVIDGGYEPDGCEVYIEARQINDEYYSVFKIRYGYILQVMRG
jgi:hypothetical protein